MVLEEFILEDVISEDMIVEGVNLKDVIFGRRDIVDVISCIQSSDG